MYRHIIVYAVTLLAATSLPSIASAQLTASERGRAEAIARVQAQEQAKADAEQRAKERRIRLDIARARCGSSNRRWDSANEVCKPR